MRWNARIMHNIRLCHKYLRSLLTHRHMISPCTSLCTCMCLLAWSMLTRCVKWTCLHVSIGGCYTKGHWDPTKLQLDTISTLESELLLEAPYVPGQVCVHSWDRKEQLPCVFSCEDYPACVDWFSDLFGWWPIDPTPTRVISVHEWRM